MLYRSIDEDGKSKLTKFCLYELASKIHYHEQHQGHERNRLTQQQPSKNWDSWRPFAYSSPSWLWTRTRSVRSCPGLAATMVRSTSPGGFRRMSPVIDDAPNCINFHVSKEQDVIEKLVYYLIDVFGVHDELLWAYHRSLRNATGKRNWSWAAACSCESLHASSAIWTEQSKFKDLDTKSFGEYLEQ